MSRPVCYSPPMTTTQKDMKAAHQGRRDAAEARRMVISLKILESHGFQISFPVAMDGATGRMANLLNDERAAP